MTKRDVGIDGGEVLSSFCWTVDGTYGVHVRLRQSLSYGTGFVSSTGVLEPAGVMSGGVVNMNDVELLSSSCDVTLEISVSEMDADAELVCWVLVLC